MNRRQALTGLAASVAAGLLVAPGRAAADADALFPSTFPLPDGFPPEGIAIGARPYAYFGSRADGSIYRASLITGEGRVITQGPGTPSLGMKLDQYGRLFVAGGNAGDGRVINGFTGEVLITYRFTAEPSMVNDVILTPEAAYFTDSRNPFLYVLPFGADSSLPGPDSFIRLPLTGQIVYGPGNNANGIARTPDQSALIIVQTNAGKLFRVEPATGVATETDLGGESLPNGDGLLLNGRTLYVVQNRLNTVAAVWVSVDGLSGTVVDRVSDANFDIPTTAAQFGPRLYLPNARFTTPVTATTKYWVTAISRT
jgi:sugar lactone lactonase YvrE